MLNLTVTPEEAQLILNALHALNPGGGTNHISTLLNELESQTGIIRDGEAALRLIDAAELTNL